MHVRVFGNFACGNPAGQAADFILDLTSVVARKPPPMGQLPTMLRGMD